jgi:predicted XRE-type DNA-binding protein
MKRDLPDLVETSAGSNVFKGTGNIFFDLGFPDAEELTTKLRLAVAVNKILKGRELTQKQAAVTLGITQPKVSALQNYKLEGFSVEKLMRFATALAYDVVIELRPRVASDGEGRVFVVAAA